MTGGGGAAARTGAALPAALAVLLLAGCGPGPKIDPLAGGGGLAGWWESTDGTFSARFDDGAFLATDARTGRTSRQGGYVVLSTTELELRWREPGGGREHSALCQRPQADALDCAGGRGEEFFLRKREEG